MPYPEDDAVRCQRCHRVTPGDELDGMLWCEECVAAERRRARRWGRGLGIGAVALLALWIALAIRPGDQFRYLWAIVLIVALGLTVRLARELVFGVVRVRNRPGVRAGADTGRDDEGA